VGKKPKKDKYYVVWKGHRPGIYTSWDECKKQVSGAEGAKFKSFATKEEAEAAFGQSYEAVKEKKEKKDLFELQSKTKPILSSISVDAACAGNPGKLEFRGVFTATETVLFKRGPYPLGTVNIGEFLAIVLALAYLKKNKLDYPVYSDSKTAIAWVRNKRINTKMERNDRNAELFQAIDRAVQWLKENSFTTNILKWNTEEWGEIPADYGRK
jgi:ribonuclease HI